ncbi:MAG: helix-turn-helix domain-containing protein [Rhodanobacter sp.]
MNNSLNAAGPRSPWISINELSPALGPLLERSQVRALAKNAIEPVPMPAAWQDIGYRQAAMESTVENMIAWQIRINREERGLKQDQLATRMGTGQSAISKLEDTEGGDVLVSTLVKAAHAFDCALLVRFVDYAEFAAATHDVRPERLFAAGFSNPSKTVRVARKRIRVIEHGKQ